MVATKLIFWAFCRERVSFAVREKVLLWESKFCCERISFAVREKFCRGRESFAAREKVLPWESKFCCERVSFAVSASFCRLYEILKAHLHYEKGGTDRIKIASCFYTRERKPRSGYGTNFYPIRSWQGPQPVAVLFRSGSGTNGADKNRFTLENLADPFHFLSDPFHFFRLV